MFLFGPFELDAHSQRICKNGVRIRLQTKPFHLLLMLVEHAGEMDHSDGADDV